MQDSNSLPFREWDSVLLHGSCLWVPDLQAALFTVVFGRDHGIESRLQQESEDIQTFELPLSNAHRRAWGYLDAKEDYKSPVPSTKPLFCLSVIFETQCLNSRQSDVPVVSNCTSALHSPPRQCICASHSAQHK